MLLSGLKVIELASVLAGPTVGQFLAELGAEVIKIENPKTGGDVTRSWRLKSESDQNLSAYFSCANWGKKSLALDISHEKGHEIVMFLLQKADIVLTSYKPGSAEKLGLDYESVRKINDKIIYGSITSFGRGNNKAGYDAIIQAEAGFMSMNGQPGGASLKMPVALMDVLAAHHLKESILLALLEKQRSGKGAYIEVSLIQAAISSLANQATNWLVAGEVPQKKGSAHPNIAPYGDVFITKDKKEIILAVGNNSQFKALCDLIGLHHLTSDERFLHNQNRVGHRELLNEFLQDKISEWNRNDLLDALNKQKIPAGAIRQVDEVFESPEALEVILKNESYSGIKQFISKGFLQASDICPPPGLGQHTYEILQSIGISSEEYEHYKNLGLIV